MRRTCRNFKKKTIFRYDYGLNDQLDRLTKYGIPFWVTEFANWHSQNDGAQIDSVEKQMAQMDDMVGTCEGRDDVFRYAWFVSLYRLLSDDHPNDLFIRWISKENGGLLWYSLCVD